MADAALASGTAEEAKRELETASELFAAAPQTRANRIAAGETQTRLADVEISMGQPRDAESRLLSYRPEVSQLSDAYLALYFDTVLGTAQAQTGEVESAERNLRAAIELSNLQLGSLHSAKPRLDWERQSSQAYRHLVQLQMTEGRVAEALSDWESYLDSLSGGAPAGVPPSRQLMPNGGNSDTVTILSLAILPKGVALWATNSRQTEGRFVPYRGDEIRVLVHRFRALCASPLSDLEELRASGKALYGVFVQPVENKLGRSLVVELDDQLAGLPIDALVDAQGRYLNDKVTISYTSSSYRSGHSSARQTISTDSPILTVGVPASAVFQGAPLTPLPDAVTEAEWVARNFRSAEILAGDDARLAAVSTRIGSVALFHFAGHAVSSNAQSGLVLADGLLGAGSVEGRSWPRLKLAVFSACDTQSNSFGGSRAYESLVRGFLHAGAANVVASSWDVDSEATRQFMQLFYARLLDGKTVSDALHGAEGAMRSMPGRGHPYYWSAFAAFA
jgi:CHAT domain-containing protein